MWGRAKALDAREAALNAREADLETAIASAEKYHEELKALHAQLRETEALLRRSSDAMVANETMNKVTERELYSTCEWCGYEGTLQRLPVYNGETRRIKRRWMCSSECQENMDFEQRSLAEDMVYVRKSLGVTS